MELDKIICFEIMVRGKKNGYLKSNMGCGKNNGNQEGEN